MAALQFLLRARNFDTLLHRSSFVVNKIACSIRYISEGKIYDFKLQQNLLGKLAPDSVFSCHGSRNEFQTRAYSKPRSGSHHLVCRGPYQISTFIRPVSSQSQGNFLTDLKSSPPPALYLGFSGAIPFCGLAAMAFIFPEHLHLIAHAQQAYGACILSFLGAIHWGFALVKTSELMPDWSTLGYSVTPSLIAWLALLAKPVPGLTTLCIGLTIALSRDLKTPYFPPWYYALRKALSTLAVSSIGLTAAVLYFH